MFTNKIKCNSSFLTSIDFHRYWILYNIDCEWDVISCKIKLQCSGQIRFTMIMAGEQNLPNALNLQVKVEIDVC